MRRARSLNCLNFRRCHVKRLLLVLVAVAVLWMVADVVRENWQSSPPPAQQAASEGLQPGVTQVSANTDAISRQEYDRLVSDNQRLNASLRQLGADFEDLVHADAKLTLRRLDRCIDATAHLGEDRANLPNCGSFSDWFVFEIDAARKAGATKRDIEARLDRVFSLAKEGKYYSGLLRTVDEQGENALRDFLDAYKK